MKHRSLSVLCTLVLAAIVGLMVAGPAAATSVDTEDVLHMFDGRVLHGTIVSETDTSIVFETVDESVNIRMKVTIAKSGVAKIERDVEIPGTGGEESGPAKPASKTGTTGGATDERHRIGAAVTEDESVPGFYVIPMKGQMGTDIHIDIYREIIDDILARDPEVIVWEMNCNPTDELMLSTADERESGLADLAQYRDLVHLLRHQLGDARQVMWVHDSVGISSCVALAWAEMYMHPQGQLGGIGGIYQMAADWADPDVRAKMIAALIGIANGFLENGGYPTELGWAMMDPGRILSATWRGRTVEWSLDKSGEYLVDDKTNASVSFRAKTAEDFCISQGTAETVEDLALLLGYREFRIIDGEANATVEAYVKRWREVYEQTKVWSDQVNDEMAGRGAPTQQESLAKAKSLLTKILNAMNRYKAVELRWQTDAGITKLDVITTIEQIKELLRQGGGGGRGGGGGGRGPGTGDG